MSASNVLLPLSLPASTESPSAGVRPSGPRPIDLRALRGASRDSLTPGQRRLAVGAIVAAHAAGVWALLQVDAVRDAVRETAPLFVDWIAPPTPPAPPVVPAAPVTPSRPQPVKSRPPPPLVTAAPRPSMPDTAMTAPPPDPAPSPTPAPAPAPVVAAAPAPAPIVAPPAPPAPSPPPAPKVIPASAVQYLAEPAPDYPRLSVRAGESGRVLVLVFIDEAGMPHQVQVAGSSGFARLDGAAVAAVQKVRFRPPTLNGQAISGWANVPIDFGLEK